MKAITLVAVLILPTVAIARRLLLPRRLHTDYRHRGLQLARRHCVVECRRAFRLPSRMDARPMRAVANEPLIPSLLHNGCRRLPDSLGVFNRPTVHCGISATSTVVSSGGSGKTVDLDADGRWDVEFRQYLLTDWVTADELLDVDADGPGHHPDTLHKRPDH